MLFRAALTLSFVFALFLSVASAQYAMTTSYTAPDGPSSSSTATAPAPVAAETMLLPAFDGGLEALRTSIQAQLVYPAVAQANGIEGAVVAKVRIDALGNPTVVQVVKSLSADCDAAAVAAIESLEGFAPARLNGEPFARTVKLEVRFRL